VRAQERPESMPARGSRERRLSPEARRPVVSSEAARPVATGAMALAPSVLPLTVRNNVTDGHLFARLALLPPCTQAKRDYEGRP
jgi:hypothetical protein